MTELVLLVCVVVGLSFICSLCEAALYAVPMGAVEFMAQEGKLYGRLLKKFKLHVDKPIAAILSLNTIANTAGAMITGAAFVAVFGEHRLWAFSIAFTGIILFFSEIVPKTIGVVFSRPVSRFAAFPIQFFVWALAPLVWLITRSTSLIVPKKRQTVTPQEIMSLARLSREEGGIALLEESIIHNILQLHKKKAAAIMTPRTVVTSLDSDLTLREAHEKSQGWPHSRVPVYKEDNEDIVGFVLRRDVFNAMVDGGGDRKLSDLMIPVHFVPKTARADELLMRFLEKRQHLFVVVDEYGGMAGVVTLEDVLEEIIGREIVGESDPAVDMAEMARRRRRQIAGGSGK
jgi:CBS domain containing-hemolysin-like protein